MWTPARDAADVSAGRLRPGEPLGVYVHFPFCSVRCPYCDFAVDTRGDVPHDAYADAVVAEIDARRAWFDGAGRLVSIYFGGGTPGLWRADALGRVLDAARAAFGAPAAAELEVTVEVNPGEVGEAQLGRCARAASTGCRLACRRSTMGCWWRWAATTTGRRAPRACARRARPGSTTCRSI